MFGFKRKHLTEKFQPGDVVRLNSGSPWFTVLRYDYYLSDRHVVVTWITTLKIGVDIQTAMFPEACLTKQ